MASPVVYGSSAGNNVVSGSLGAHPPRSQLPVETAIDRNWHFDQGQHKSKCRKETAEFLEQSLQGLAKNREPAEHDGVARQVTIERLQDLLRDIHVFPPPCQLQLVPYGSFQSTCYSRSSDLDLALTGWVSETVLGRHASASKRVVSLEQLERNDCRLLLLRLADALEVRRLTKGPVDRNPLEARVPIIKFEEANSGIECDVCVTTRGCDFKASIMRLLHGLQPSLAPLIQLVKVWAKHHDINSAHCATFNSWSLALMVMFSLQCFPEGHLLPPLWKIFHSEEPTGPGGKGRPLQDKDLPLDVMLSSAQGRCLDEADRLVASVWANSAQPTLLAQLLWFFSCFATILCQWRDNTALRNWRVSAWLGRGFVARFPKAYLAPVEEPFDCNDNTARSLGIKERHEQTLPYVAWVFSHSVHVLRNVTTVEDAARALVWLFGTEALPCVGLHRLKLPQTGIPATVMLRLEKMAGVQRTRNGEEQPEEAQADTAMDEYEKYTALRSVIDTTKVGSPIMSLSDWRHYMESTTGRSRAPHAWHPLAMPSRPQPLTSPPPLPTRMIASPQTPSSLSLDNNHTQYEQLLRSWGTPGTPPTGRWMNPHMSPEQTPPELLQLQRMAGRGSLDGIIGSVPKAEEHPKWSFAEELDVLISQQHPIPHGPYVTGQHPQHQKQEQPHPHWSLASQQEHERRHQSGLSLGLLASGFTNYDIRVSNGQEEQLGNGFRASVAAGMSGVVSGVTGVSGGFGGFMATGGGGFGDSPEPLVPMQHQHQHAALQETMQHPMQQHSPLQQPIQPSMQSSVQRSMDQSMQQQQLQHMSPPGISGPGPLLNMGFGAMAGQALLEALRGGSSKDKAMEAATGARSAVAGTAGVACGAPMYDATVAGSDGVSIYDAVIAAPAPKPQGQSAFTTQQKSRPVSVFTLYSGMQQHQEIQQKQPPQPQPYPQPQAPLEGPSVSSPFSLSMSLTTSGASQLLLPEPLQPVVHPPPPVPVPPQQQEQEQQPSPELQELLRLLSVSPTSHTANMPRPPQSELPPGLMGVPTPQLSSMPTSNGTYQTARQSHAKAPNQPEALQSPNTIAAWDSIPGAGGHQSSTYHRQDEGRSPSYNPLVGLQASSQESHRVFPTPSSSLMRPQSSRQEEQQQEQQQTAHLQQLQNPSFAGPHGLGPPFPSSYASRSSVGFQGEGPVNMAIAASAVASSGSRRHHGQHPSHHLNQGHHSQQQQHHPGSQAAGQDVLPRPQGPPEPQMQSPSGLPYSNIFGQPQFQQRNSLDNTHPNPYIFNDQKRSSSSGGAGPPMGNSTVLVPNGTPSVPSYKFVNGLPYPNGTSNFFGDGSVFGGNDGGAHVEEGIGYGHAGNIASRGSGAPVFGLAAPRASRGHRRPPGF